MRRCFYTKRRLLTLMPNVEVSEMWVVRSNYKYHCVFVCSLQTAKVVTHRTYTHIRPLLMKFMFLVTRLHVMAVSILIVLLYLLLLKWKHLPEARLLRTVCRLWQQRRHQEEEVTVICWSFLVCVHPARTNRNSGLKSVIWTTDCDSLLSQHFHGPLAW